MALARPGYAPSRPTIVPAIGGGGTTTSAWTDLNLGSMTMTDAQSLYTASGSTLSTVSTIVLNGTNHGRMDTVDGLFFTLQLGAFDRTKHFGVAIRANWSNTLVGTWEMYLGMGNDSAPVTDGGVYLSTQMKSSANVGGNDYGQTPTTNQSVTDARYLAGMINYRSDRQDGSCGQSANAARTGRAGQNRSVDPGTAMSDNDQYILVGFGNQSARADGSYNATLTDLKVQFQLLAHYGQD
jgi:hypothetical protein